MPGPGIVLITLPLCTVLLWTWVVFTLQPRSFNTVPATFDAVSFSRGTTHIGGAVGDAATVSEADAVLLAGSGSGNGTPSTRYWRSCLPPLG